MSDIPSELKYTKSHEWVRLDDDGSITVGVTDHAQELLGDIVFIELPEVNTQVNAGDDAGVIESVKAASDLYSPMAGEITAINEDLADAPETINSDPYCAGWIFKLNPADEGEMGELLDADSYEEFASDEEH